MSCSAFSTMDHRLDAIDQLFAEEDLEHVIDSVMDYIHEKQIDSPYTPQGVYQRNLYPQSVQTSYSSSTSTASSPESFHQPALSPSSASSCYSLSPPASAYSSSSETTWSPSDSPPSTSSSTSSTDSNVFHFPATPAEPQRPKRSTRATRATASPKSPVQPATRGRGRPMKDNTEGDQTVIRKRIYAREYRKKNQKTHDELFACLIDFYTTARNNGMNFAKMFPQHKKVISEILKTL